MSRTHAYGAGLLRGAPVRAGALNGRLRELLELLAALRDLQGPITTPEGLRGALAVLEQLAALLGADDDWLAWLRRFSQDDALLRIAAAVVEYLWSRRAAEAAGASWAAQDVDALALQDWLPLLIELLELLRALQGSRS